MKLLTNLDLSRNEIKNVVIHNLPSHPSEQKEGQVYFNTSQNQHYAYRNGKWTVLGSDSIADIIGLQDALDSKGSIENEHNHKNKAVLDGIDEDRVTKWDSSVEDAKDYTDAQILEINGGAPSSSNSLKKISDTLDAHKESIDTLDALAKTKADDKEIKSILATKANLVEVNNELSAKADAETVNSELEKKALKSVVEQMNVDLSNAINTKMDIHAHPYKSENWYPTWNDVTDKPTIPTKTSQLTNDSNFLTEHQDISGKADKSEIPTKVSQLTNDRAYLTSVPSEYVTDSELNSKGYAAQTFVQSEIAKVEGELDKKVNNFYGTNNVGKILMVGEDGYLVIGDAVTGEVPYPVVGTVDDDNVITLSSDKLADGLYTLRYSNGEGYEEIGKILVGEKIVTKITATKVATSYKEGETLTTDDITVIAYYNDGTSSSVTGYKVDSSLVNMSTKGTYQLKISYMNCTVDITIIVNSLSVPKGNLLVPSTCTIGYRLNSTGELREQAGTFLTDYIEIGDCMSNGSTNTIHWQGFHLYAITSSEYTDAGVEPNGGTVGTYKGVAYYDSSNKFLGQDSLYVTPKAYDSEGNYQLVLNNTYTTAIKIRIWGVTLPPATSVNELQNCKLTLNQLISEI